ncbi:hydantoinase/oxoprolinase family protein [Ectothiorhodospiraceae bacterium 2226]|nr:hydantoinase/oxoprolinase family protein [Ectothiorhodospiraceae bacterium 2226]
MRTRLLGVDAGGTFTDFVWYEDGRLRIHKVLSTPDAPEAAILQGLTELGLTGAGLAGLHVVHGSTVATNAALEGKGVRTAFVTNRGFKDLLTLGRQARRALYDLQPPPVAPPVPPELCLETGGRLGATGELVEPLTDADLAALRAAIEALAPEAVAINLLFSYLDDRAERRIAAALPPGLFVSRSSEVLPEYREYERGIATWLNAWLGPRVQGYLARLRERLAPASLAIMQGSGGTVDADQAGRQAVNMLLSGPAGGLAGARFVGEAVGRTRLLTFDMGGTSTDVALIDGELTLTSEGRIGPWPLAVPTVDVHTIGAGGGSIAAVDAGGLLQVGPTSAGADPGPACYGRGGTAATVTDANLVLGRLRPDAFLGGAMALDVERARAALTRLGAALGLAPEAAAEGVVRVANEHMARALRVMSVQRGVDPRELTLVSFGGAGGLHVCALAEALGMREALVPVHGGVLSALGMLAAPPTRRLSRSVTRPLRGFPAAGIAALLGELEAGGRAALAQEGVAADAVAVSPSLDVRYQGQSAYLNVPWPSASDAGLEAAVEAAGEAAGEAFEQAHEQAFGHRLALPVELVNVRLAVEGPRLPLTLGAPEVESHAAPQFARLWGLSDEVAVWRREALAVGAELAGPALVVETVATTYLAPGWRARVDHAGNLLLQRVA